MLHMPEEKGSGGMYTDLAVGLNKDGHQVTVMAPDNAFASSYIREERGMKVVRVKCRKTLGESNLIKKGIGLALMPRYYKKAYNRFLKNETFDWIFMPTPPITLVDFVNYVKNRTEAKFYLILRDIHPQSVKSIGLIKYQFMYDYLEKRARKGYEIANYIGCMSQGNIDFILTNYPSLNPSKAVLLYNWLKKETIPDLDIEFIKAKYGLKGKTIALFGGTIGLGQRIENIVFLSKHYLDNDNLRFLVIGKGVEKARLMQIAKEENLTNIVFLDFMPQAEYLTFMSKADIGLISINENYKVPTCPSKAGAYMSFGIPIFAMINPNNDYKDYIENSGAGLVVIGNDREQVIERFDQLLGNKYLRKTMSEAGIQFYNNYLTVDKAVETINGQIQKCYE